MYCLACLWTLPTSRAIDMPTSLSDSVILSNTHRICIISSPTSSPSSSSTSISPKTPTHKLTTTPPTDHTIAKYKMNVLIEYISHSSHYSNSQKTIFNNIKTET